jgi:frataxin
MAGFTDAAFLKASDDFLAKVEGVFDEINDPAIEDLDLASGVLEVTTRSGKFVINRQAPNKQLWLSSPLSGPHHYDLVGESANVAWKSDRDGHDLREKLEQEFSTLLRRRVSIPVS